MKRTEELEIFLKSLNDNPSFEGVDFTDINATNSEGENALHMSISQENINIAQELIELGIYVNARGDLGRTPLHEAASRGNIELVKLLVENGADLFALDEGVPPFTLARYSKNDDICDYLGEKMKIAQTADRSVWKKAEISHLEREIKRLKGLL